jgi:microsomal dipeptidase-like Zn-dependent dipeptidase
MCAVGSDYFGILDHREPEGLDITKFAALWNELMDRGMSRSAIEKVFSGNALRVIGINAQRCK